jgi:hypothetical protein
MIGMYIRLVFILRCIGHRIITACTRSPTIRSRWNLQQEDLVRRHARMRRVVARENKTLGIKALHKDFNIKEIPQGASQRWHTTSRTDQLQVLNRRDELPDYSQIQVNMANRKIKNTSTSIDNSGFGDATDPKDYLSTMHEGMQNMTAENIAAVSTTQAERDAQAQRKYNFKFKAQFSLGYDSKTYYDQASTLPKPTTKETLASHEWKNSSLDQMIKQSKLDYLFDAKKFPSKNFQSTARYEGRAPKMDVKKMTEERVTNAKMKVSSNLISMLPAHCATDKKMLPAHYATDASCPQRRAFGLHQADLQKNQFDLTSYAGQKAPTKGWKTCQQEQSRRFTQKELLEASGGHDTHAEALVLKQNLQAHHFKLGGDQVDYTSDQHRAFISFNESRDPAADAAHALALKKALQKSSVQMGWQHNYR